MHRKVSKKFASVFRTVSGSEGAANPHGPERPWGRGARASKPVVAQTQVREHADTPDTFVRIDLDRQCLELRGRGEVHGTYPVSTAANGPGEQEGSECTPRGRHVIRARIGAGAAPGTVFVGRRPTGERYTPALGVAYPDRDWILTRILWLSGTEPGRNRLGRVDTMRRYIYIHGCPDDVDITTPGSHGCIRMRNADVIDLFDRVEAGTTVVIEAQASESGAMD